jgi:hypothetical protein
MKISVGKAQKLKTLSGIFDVHRKMNVNTVNTPAIEWTEADLGTFEPVREMVADDLGDPLLITNPFRARVKGIAASVRVSQSPLGPVLSSAPPDDDLAIPPFLKGERATA